MWFSSRMWFSLSFGFLCSTKINLQRGNKSKLSTVPFMCSRFSAQHSARGLDGLGSTIKVSNSHSHGGGPLAGRLKHILLRENPPLAYAELGTID